MQGPFRELCLTVRENHRGDQRGWRAMGSQGGLESWQIKRCECCSPGPTLTMISTRLWENFSMTDSIQINGLTCRQQKRKFLEALGVSLRPLQWGFTLLHLGAQTVGHELEVAVGRDEGDSAVIVKAREPHALVEFHVLQLHGLVLAP